MPGPGSRPGDDRPTSVDPFRTGEPFVGKAPDPMEHAPALRQRMLTVVEEMLDRSAGYRLDGYILSGLSSAELVQVHNFVRSFHV